VRRTTALLQEAGWKAGRDREYLAAREGLKVPAKQKPRGRLWLNDGSCIRLRPERPNHDLLFHRQIRHEQSETYGISRLPLTTWLHAEGQFEYRQLSLPTNNNSPTVQNKFARPPRRFSTLSPDLCITVFPAPYCWAYEAQTYFRRAKSRGMPLVRGHEHWTLLVLPFLFAGGESVHLGSVFLSS
jgi:hypothetical protein